MSLINTRKAYTYFKNRFIMKKTSQNWYAFDNPFDPDGDGKRKMAVHFGYAYVKCWRTGWRGSIVDFVMAYEQLSYYDAKMVLNEEVEGAVDLEVLDQVRVIAENANVELPEGFTPITEVKGVIGKRAVKYLEGRGFDIEVLDRQGFGYVATKAKEVEDNFFGYIIVPFKRNGSLYYYLGRDFMGNFLRYKNPNKMKVGVGKEDLVYNEDALVLCRTNFITEGWTDAATLGREGIATLGWSLSNTQKTKIYGSNADKMVFVPDIGVKDEKTGETYYQAATKAAAEFMGKFEVYVVDLAEYSDIGKDVNEIGKENVMYKYKHTEPLTQKKVFEIIM